jgi:hypothetical protein
VTHRTVQSWCNLAVWLQFRPKTSVFFLQQLFKYKTLIVYQESSTASDFEYPCKPLLCPSPELMQPQPSLRVVHGSIVWRQHMRGACGRWKWEVLGRRGHSEAKIALAVPAWHRAIHRTVFYRWSKFENTPSFSKRRSVPYSSYRTVGPSAQACIY